MCYDSMLAAFSADRHRRPDQYRQHIEMIWIFTNGAAEVCGICLCSMKTDGYEAGKQPFSRPPRKFAAHGLTVRGKCGLTGCKEVKIWTRDRN